MPKNKQDKSKKSLKNHDDIEKALEESVQTQVLEAQKQAPSGTQDFKTAASKTRSQRNAQRSQANGGGKNKSKPVDTAQSNASVGSSASPSAVKRRGRPSSQSAEKDAPVKQALRKATPSNRARGKGKNDKKSSDQDLNQNLAEKPAEDIQNGKANKNQKRKGSAARSQKSNAKPAANKAKPIEQLDPNQSIDDQEEVQGIEEEKKASEQVTLKKGTRQSDALTGSNKQPQRQSLAGRKVMDSTHKTRQTQLKLEVTSQASSRSSKIGFINETKEEQSTNDQEISDNLRLGDRQSLNNMTSSDQQISQSINFESMINQKMPFEETKEEVNGDSAFPINLNHSMKSKPVSQTQSKAGIKSKQQSIGDQSKSRQTNQGEFKADQNSSLQCTNLIEEERKLVDEETQKRNAESLKQRQDENEEYQQWQRVKVRIFQNEINKILRRGFPMLWEQSELEQLKSNFNLEDFKVTLQKLRLKYEDSEDLFDSSEFQKLLMSFLGLFIEGSSLNSQNLTNLCLQALESYGIRQYLQDFEEFHLEAFLSKFSKRKRYGAKLPNEKSLKDEHPRALYCQELQDYSHFSISDSKIRKLKEQRTIQGKIVEKAHLLIELAADISNFENEDKFQKMNTEYEAFQGWLRKLGSLEAPQRARRSIDLGTTAEGQNQNSQEVLSSGINSKSTKQEVSRRHKPHENDEKEAEVTKQQKDVKPQQVAPIVPPKPVKDITSFFPLKPIKKKDDEPILVPAIPQVSQNNWIKLKPFTIKPMAKQFQELNQFPQWEPLNKRQLIDIINEHKLRDQQRSKLEQQEQMSDQPSQKPCEPKLKHIEIYKSAMKYDGDRFSKKSQIINCRNPFLKDRSCLDYDQTSEDEWQELHCEDLMNDELLLEEDGSEMNNDDPDLRREGFIVPDDYFSQSSQNSVEADDYESDYDKKKAQMNKELIKRAQENQQRLMSINHEIRPYILSSCDFELKYFKAKTLPRKITTNLGTEGKEASSSSKYKEISKMFNFPLKPISEKIPELVKVDIKNFIRDIIEMGHGIQGSKKQLIDMIRQRFPDLKKSRVDTFVKECFDKERRAPDQKEMRLYAKTEVVEKYGGDELLIQNLPIILEQRRDDEIRLKNLELQGDLQMIEAQSAGEGSRRTSRISSQKASKMNSQNDLSKYLERTEESNSKPQSRSRFRNSQPTSQFQLPASRASNMSTKQRGQTQSQISQLKNESLSSKIISDEKMEGDFDHAGMDQGRLNEMIQSKIQQSGYKSAQKGEENSHVSFQDKGAFMSAGSVRRKSSQTNQAENEESNQDLDVTFDEYQHLRHQEDRAQFIAQNYLEEDDIHLSQQAVVQLRCDEEEKQLEIQDDSFTRNTQQNQSTPIHDFKKLKSVSSTTHSQTYASKIRFNPPEALESLSQGGRVDSKRRSSRSRARNSQAQEQEGERDEMRNYHYEEEKAFYSQRKADLQSLEYSQNFNDTEIKNAIFSQRANYDASSCKDDMSINGFSNFKMQASVMQTPLREGHSMMQSLAGSAMGHPRSTRLEQRLSQIKECQMADQDNQMQVDYHNMHQRFEEEKKVWDLNNQSNFIDQDAYEESKDHQELEIVKQSKLKAAQDTFPQRRFDEERCEGAMSKNSNYQEGDELNHASKQNFNNDNEQEQEEEYMQ